MKGRHLRSSFLLFNFLVINIFSLNGQTTAIYISDEVTNRVLSDVEVIVDDFKSLGFTDAQGIALVETSKYSIFRFSKEGYSFKSFSRAELVALNWRISLSPLSDQIEEIILIGQPSFKEYDKFHLTETITKKDIQKTNPQTSADILTQNGNVYVQKSQMGGGSPIIRGFEANRVLLVVDGVRMNNAIYRNGHLQNAITVDASALENVKVLFGPNSLAYGSDAIGGVVAYSTKTPLFATDGATKMDLNVFSRYASANQEKTLHADISLGWKNLALLTSVTATDYDDLRSGGNRNEQFLEFGKRPNFAQRINGIDQLVINTNPNIQVGTAYHQYDILQKLVFKASEDLYINGNIQISNTGNVPRYDNLQEVSNGGLRYSEWNYGPQKRFLSSVQIKNYSGKSFYDQYILTGAFQKVKEERITRNFNNDNKFNQNEDVSVYSVSGEFKKKISSEIGLFYGFDSQINSVNSTAFSENIEDNTISFSVLTRYANGKNKYNTYGFFLEADWSRSNSPVSLKAGLRFSGNDWQIKYNNNGTVEWPMNFTEGVSGDNQAFNWSLSGLYESDNAFYLRGLISSAFRAPNIDDLSKIRVNSNEITFPNLNLQPEKSISTELSTGFKNESINISSTLFFTRLNDAITRRAFTTPEGFSTYENFGEILLVVGNQNVQNANIYGISMNGEITYKEWKLKGSWNYTQGREKIDGQEDLPFAHIPPLYGNVRLSHEKEAWTFDLEMRYNGSKDIEDFGGSVDNPDLATAIGSLSWTTLNIYSTFSIDQKIAISCGLENIFDTHYRPFGSGVSAAGRNLILSMRYSI